MHTLQGARDRGGGRTGGGGHLHIEQLGGLVHADGDGALTPRLAEHFLQGISYRVHPADGRGESGSAGSPAAGGAAVPESAGTLTFRSSALPPRIPPKSYCKCESLTWRAGCSCPPSARRRLCACSHPPASLAKSP